MTADGVEADGVAMGQPCSLPVGESEDDSVEK